MNIVSHFGKNCVERFSYGYSPPVRISILCSWV